MRPLRVLPLVAALILGHVPAAAAVRLEGLPERVRPGDQVEIRWSGLDPDVEEVELELSVAGSGWVRISPEMEALAGRFTWRVGGGLSGPAAVRLRAGGAGREREVARHALVIVSLPRSQPAEILEWPEGWDLDRCAGPAAGGALAAARAGYSGLVESTGLALAPFAGPLRDDGAPLAREASARDLAGAIPAARAFRAPRRLPLRN